MSWFASSGHYGRRGFFGAETVRAKCGCLQGAFVQSRLGTPDWLENESTLGGTRLARRMPFPMKRKIQATGRFERPGSRVVSRGTRSSVDSAGRMRSAALRAGAVGERSPQQPLLLPWDRLVFAAGCNWCQAIIGGVEMG